MSISDPAGASSCCCLRCGPPWRDHHPEPTSWAERLAWRSWMPLCARCGSKRCLGAADHRNPCRPVGVTAHTDPENGASQ